MPDLEKNTDAAKLMVQLPIWKNEHRGLPNAFARSALFTVGNIRSAEREQFKRKLIATTSGIDMTYTGEELLQDDEDVFLQIMHLARLQPLGERVQFVAHQFLKVLGWSINSESYVRLANSIERMQASGLRVIVSGDPKNPKRSTTFQGSLVRKFITKEDDGQTPLAQWVVMVEPEIVAMFGDTDYSRVEWNARLKLAPLAKWLHSFYHTHRSPFDLKVETIMRLCGTKMTDKAKFRYKLRQALKALVDIQFFFEAYVDTHTDLVVVKRIHQHAIVER